MRLSTTRWTSSVMGISLIVPMLTAARLTDNPIPSLPLPVLVSSTASSTSSVSSTSAASSSSSSTSTTPSSTASSSITSSSTAAEISLSLPIVVSIPSSIVPVLTTLQLTTEDSITTTQEITSQSIVSSSTTTSFDLRSLSSSQDASNPSTSRQHTRSAKQESQSSSDLLPVTIPIPVSISISIPPVTLPPPTSSVVTSTSDETSSKAEKSKEHKSKTEPESTTTTPFITLPSISLPDLTSTTEPEKTRTRTHGNDDTTSTSAFITLPTLPTDPSLPTTDTAAQSDATTSSTSVMTILPSLSLPSLSLPSVSLPSLSLPSLSLPSLSLPSLSLPTDGSATTTPSERKTRTKNTDESSTSLFITVPPFTGTLISFTDLSDLTASATSFSLVLPTQSTDSDSLTTGTASSTSDAGGKNTSGQPTGTTSGPITETTSGPITETTSGTASGPVTGKTSGTATGTTTGTATGPSGPTGTGVSSSQSGSSSTGTATGPSTDSTGGVIPTTVSSSGTGSIITTRSTVQTGKPATTSSGTATITGSAESSTGPGKSESKTTEVPPATTGTITTVPSVVIPTSTSAVFSLAPIGTDSATIKNVPSSIIVQMSSTQITTGHPSTLPSNVPQIVFPSNGPPPSPTTNSVALIQVGFDYGLNYPFVVNHHISSTQIFSFLPVGIAWGLGINTSDVTMQALQPYGTTSTNGYIATVALAWIPSNLVTTLALDIHTAVSKLYQNPDPSVYALMNMINPAIPIIPGTQLTPSGTGADNGAPAMTVASIPSTTTPNGNTNGAPLGGQGSSTGSKIQASSVGIGVGVVAGAAVYGVAMFLVARRYKKRRASHRRASSLLDGYPDADHQAYSDGAPEMSMYGASSYNAYGGAAVMSGGRGGANPAMRDSRGSGSSSHGASVRSAGISAPLMQENSLGW